MKAVIISMFLIAICTAGMHIADSQAEQMHAIENRCAGFNHDTGAFQWEPAMPIIPADMLAAPLPTHKPTAPRRSSDHHS